MNKKPTAPQKMDVNARELHNLEFLAGLDAQLIQGGEILKERLATIPNGWRNFRLATATTQRVLDAIYETIPDKTMRHMRRLRDCGQIVIRPRPMIKMPDDVQIVPTADLRTLINHVIEGECAMCVKDVAGQKGCELRKALMVLAPTGGVHKDGRCAYIDVVAGNELGKYI